MASIPSDGFDIAQLPGAAERRKIDVLVVSSVALAFISFWRAAAIVLCDLASTAYYIGGISEQAIGKAAPWFILGVMLFSYAVRAVYVESCTMFTRGGVYKVVKEAMGGPLAKMSVSALMFDYILTGPISGVSAGQYLAGLFGQLWCRLVYHADFDAEAHKTAINLLAALLAVGITLYFWRANLIGIHESSEKAMRIMQLTTVMAVVIIIWCALTFAQRPETRHLPTMRPVFTPESKGWLAGVRIFGVLGIIVAFGHSLLAMSGEESLAQVNREIEAPKLKNLKRAGFVIFLYSMLLTSLISFFAVMIIPDNQRIATHVILHGQTVNVVSVQDRRGADGAVHRFIHTPDGATAEVARDTEVVRDSGKYTDNLISGLAMNVVGPLGAKLALQAFVVFVGFLILAGAVNTSMVGSNGVLNRLAEDGVLTPWFQRPHPRFGTTYRLINLIALLQLFTIIASMGNVYALGEAYAFGVVWSFVFMTLSMMVLRFLDDRPRQYKVPFNVPMRFRGRQIDFPIGIGTVFLVLFSTALVNLLTKKVATVWGVSFTAGLMIVFTVCEVISVRKRGGAHHEHLEQFNQRNSEDVTRESLGLTHPNPVIVAARGPRSLPVLERVLQETNTDERDVVVVTCKLIPPLTVGIHERDTAVDDSDRELLTKIVTVAEEVGKKVFPVVLPTNNPLFAIATAARDLKANEVVLGVSEKMHADVQLEQFALAWGSATTDPTRASGQMTVRILGPQVEMRYELA